MTIGRIEYEEKYDELADYVVDNMDMGDLILYAKEQLMTYWSTAQEQFEEEYKDFLLERNK